MRHVGYRLALVATCVAALTATGAGTALAAPSRVPLTGTGYNAQYGLTDDGPSDTTLTETTNINLGVRDPAALAAYARAVSTPGSPFYGRYDSAKQVQERDELTPAQLSKVRDWLTSAGLTVTQPNWRTLTVTGTLGQFNTAFDVTFENYSDPNSQDPYRWQMPKTDLSVPAGLDELVLGVSNDEVAIPKTAKFGADHSMATGVNRPAKLGGVSYPNTASSSPSDSTCSKYWGQQQATGLPKVNGQEPSLAPCGYTPNQLRHIYGLDSSNVTGKGQTVAVVTPAMDTLEQDVDTWASHVGTQPLRPGQLSVVQTPDGSPAPPTQQAFPGMIENTLDVESVHGIAPDANIISVGLPNTNYGSLLDSLIYILDHTHATIASLSLSFDAPPGVLRAYDQVYEEGATQGVGFYYASGDGGHDLSGNFLNPAAGSDWTTGVGGTSLAIGADGSRQWETGWGDGASQLSSDGTSWQQQGNGGGAGGGWMVGKPRPWYQRDVVSDKEATGPDGKVDRTGPDVAMDADGATGLLVGGTPLSGNPTTDPSTWKYSERRIGGTSLSTPLFAGVQALAQQARRGKPFGFANPELYRLANSGAFRDIDRLTGTPPTTVVQRQISATAWAPFLMQVLGQMSQTPPSPLTPKVGPGFDTETGMGVPTGHYLSVMHGS